MTHAHRRANSRSANWRQPLRWPVGLLFLLASAGCVTDGYYAHRGRANAPSDARIPAEPAPPRTLAMFEGDTGRVATWADLMEGVAWADVVFVGEMHDHRAAHQVELAIVEDTLAACPGAAVSLEMFERHDQPFVNRYLRGEIDQATLVEATNSKGWGPKNPEKGSWEEFYQPLVDAAKANNSRVVAANSPRAYVRIASRQGYDALRALPWEERILFDIPTRLDKGDYWTRFQEVMTPDGESGSAEHLPNLESAFRAQQLWDATMGRSIAKALDTGATKVVHCVGSFHSDWHGGTVLQFRHAKPFARILTVTIVPEASDVLMERDRGRADIVVYAARGPNEGDDDEEVETPPPPSQEPATPEEGEAAPAEQPNTAGTATETPSSP